MSRVVLQETCVPDSEDIKLHNSKKSILITNDDLLIKKHVKRL